MQLYHILDVSRTNETATHTHFFCGCEYLFRVGKARLSFTLPLKNWAGALFCLSVSSFCLSMFTECQVAAETLSFCILLPSHCYLILIDTMACIHWSVMSFDGIAGTARPMFHRIQWRTTVYLNQKTCAKYICYPVFFFRFFFEAHCKCWNIKKHSFTQTKCVCFGGLHCRFIKSKFIEKAQLWHLYARPCGRRSRVAFLGIQFTS